MENETNDQIISHFSLNKGRFSRSVLDPEFFNGADHIVENMFDEIENQCNNFQKFRTYRTLIYLTMMVVAIAFVILVVMTSIGASLENFLILGLGFALCFVFIVVSIILAIWNTNRLQGLVERYGILIERIINRYNTEYLQNYGIKARYYGATDEYREVLRKVGKRKRVPHSELQMWIEFTRFDVFPSSPKPLQSAANNGSLILNQLTPSRRLSPVSSNIFVVQNPPIMVSPLRVQHVPLQQVLSPAGYATLSPYVSNF